MMGMTSPLIVIALVIAAAPSAQAETMIDTVNGCIEKAGTNEKLPSQCVDAAHQTCQRVGEEFDAQATLCFRDAVAHWSTGIRTLMAFVSENADPNMAAAASIELKYDILQARHQCDRLEEFARLTDISTNEVVRQKAGCQAAASGLAYIKLAIRARSLGINQLRGGPGGE